MSARFTVETVLVVDHKVPLEALIQYHVGNLYSHAFLGPLRILIKEHEESGILKMSVRLCISWCGIYLSACIAGWEDKTVLCYAMKISPYNTTDSYVTITAHF